MNFTALFNEAKNKNLEALEIYVSSNVSRDISIYEGEVDRFSSNEVIGYGLRGLYNGKVGTTFTEIYDDSMCELLVNQIIENASVISSDDEQLFYQGEMNYPEINSYSNELESMNNEEIIKLLKELEAEGSKLDPRITKISETSYSYSEDNIYIENSYGLKCEKKSNYAFFEINGIATENGDTQTDFEFKICKQLTDINKEELLTKLKEEILAKLNASKIPTGKYKTIIRNSAMASLLGVLTSSFDADNAQKGISIFKNDLGQKLFSEKITITDDPLLENGIASTPFDDEGVPTYKKDVVSNGVLKTFLHNQKTAHKDNIAPTGNGFKAGYAGAVTISPTNFYIQKGSSSLNELIKEMDSGCIITELNGLHAGFNALTLDFSLQANGFFVENGKISKAINLIMISGNLKEILNQVETIGEDLYFSYNACGSPSILFESIQITGE
ncbi:MAG: TldD/PmbA family protein [Erysipelotrichales bacterium]|nr:TldD/PmbA family protein [Erysipelotrichales bacterium]